MGAGRRVGSVGTRAWTHVPNPEDGVDRDFYVRQLRDWKFSCRSSGRSPPRSPRTVSVTYRDGSCGPGLDAVGRLVGRVPAASLCDVCFLRIRVLRSCR